MALSPGPSAAEHPWPNGRPALWETIAFALHPGDVGAGRLPVGQSR